MRVVADTNVYISALHFGGIPEEILVLARAGTVQLFTSFSILKETEGVLCRKFHWSARAARDAIATIQEFTQLVRPTHAICLVVEDEPDNRILECALEAHADVVISGDRHLRQLQVFQGIPIISPGEFMEIHGNRG
jgi:putative PIN family toxin of toxin-antitoxin system